MAGTPFEWDPAKDRANREKHGVGFDDAVRAFMDPRCVIVEDPLHSTDAELRWFCIGAVDGEVLTVRFTWREQVVRVFGAGYWRDGRRKYEEAHRLHR